MDFNKIYESANVFPTLFEYLKSQGVADDESIDTVQAFCDESDGRWSLESLIKSEADADQLMDDFYNWESGPYGD